MDEFQFLFTQLFSLATVRCFLLYNMISIPRQTLVSRRHKPLSTGLPRPYLESLYPVGQRNNL